MTNPSDTTQPTPSTSGDAAPAPSAESPSAMGHDRGERGERGARGDRGGRGGKFRGHRGGPHGTRGEAPSGSNASGGAEPGSAEPRRFQGGDRRESYTTPPRQAALIRTVLEQEDFATLDQIAEKYGQEWGNKPPWVKNRLSTYQIRSVIGEVEHLKRADFANDPATRKAFKLLKSRAAYLARRYYDDDLYEFARVIRLCVEVVGDDAAKFARFLDLFGAMMAYFRANGGR